MDYPDINFRHIMPTPRRTFCLSRTTPAALTQLTSTPVRPLRVFVEDDLAESIVSKALESKSARSLATITKFGSIMNAFTLAGAAALNDTLSDDFVFVLDGDQLRSDQERLHRMKQVLSGDDPNTARARERALGAIRQLVLPDGKKPEQFILDVLRAEDPESHAGSSKEIVAAAQNVTQARDAHEYVTQITTLAGYEPQAAVMRIADTLANTHAWSNYVREFISWLDQRLPAHLG